MSQKNQKIIRDFCHYHGVKESKRFNSKKVSERFDSFNTKGRKIALSKMLSDLVRWNVSKYIDSKIKHPNYKLIV